MLKTYYRIIDLEYRSTKHDEEAKVKEAGRERERGSERESERIKTACFV